MKISNILSYNKGKLGFRNFIVLFQKYNPITYCGLAVNDAKTSAYIGITATLYKIGVVAHCGA
jgi:hypothetical protein